MIVRAMLGLAFIVGLFFVAHQLDSEQHKFAAARKAETVAFLRSGDPDPQEESCLRAQMIARIANKVGDPWCYPYIDQFHWRVSFYAVDRGWNFGAQR